MATNFNWLLNRRCKSRTSGRKFFFQNVLEYRNSSKKFSGKNEHFDLFEFLKNVLEYQNDSKCQNRPTHFLMIRPTHFLMIRKKLPFSLLILSNHSI